MANPWDNDHGISHQELQDRLTEALAHGEFHGTQSVKTDPPPLWFGEGWDCDVLRGFDGSDGIWYCKLPKRSGVQAWIRKEASVLDHLKHNRFGLAPQVGLRGTPGKLPYEWLTVSEAPGLCLLHNLDRADPAELGNSCGTVLRKLHTLSESIGESIGERPPHAIHRVDSLVGESASALQALNPHVDSNHLQRVRDMVEQARGHIPEEVPTTFVHGDLYPEHIFFDKKTSQVAHIIDWADARWDDPAVDFAMLGWILGDAFLGSALDAYRPADRSSFERRIYRLGTMSGIHDIRIAEQGGPNVSLELRIEVLQSRTTEGWLERF